ncbi:MAG TPA: hypothetical protein VLE99_02805 [Candidatus Saccharimonadales bacterium]|nr:hypothetical protein [Candidatus Saccharimonadales bacterium]
MDAEFAPRRHDGTPPELDIRGVPGLYDCVWGRVIGYDVTAHMAPDPVNTAFHRLLREYVLEERARATLPDVLKAIVIAATWSYEAEVDIREVAICYGNLKDQDVTAVAVLEPAIVGDGAEERYVPDVHTLLLTPGISRAAIDFAAGYGLALGLVEHWTAQLGNASQLG